MKTKMIKIETLITLSLSELKERCTNIPFGAMFEVLELRQTHTFTDIGVDSISSIADIVIDNKDFSAYGIIDPPSPIVDGVLFGLLYLKNGNVVVTRQTKSEIETLIDND